MLETVYENTVDDGMFSVVVTSDSSDLYKGRLVVTATDSEEVILDEEVYISYGAVFGPEVSDVADWEEKALEAIDSYLEPPL